VGEGLTILTSPQPSDGRLSRLVFIARDLPRDFAQALLDAIGKCLDRFPIRVYRESGLDS